jgi:hypothetical protein
MLPQPVDTNPAYWRRRAEDAVTLAGQMHDDLSKEMMLRVASNMSALRRAWKSVGAAWVKVRAGGKSLAVLVIGPSRYDHTPRTFEAKRRYTMGGLWLAVLATRAWTRDVV